MKQVSSTLKKWNAILRNSELEPVWNKWMAFKQYQFKEFMEIIHGTGHDFFKIRALLFMIVPGYWRVNFDKKSKYRPEYEQSFQLDTSKLSQEVISFSIEILTAVLADIHQYFIESIPHPEAITIHEEDENENLQAIKSAKRGSKILSLEKLHSKFYPYEYVHYGNTFLLYNAIAADLLNVVGENDGQKLFENLFFARLPLFLSNPKTSIYFGDIDTEVPNFILRVNQIIWIKKLSRILFDLAVKEKDKNKQQIILWLYTRHIIRNIWELNISLQEKKEYLEQEISFIVENAPVGLWKQEDVDSAYASNFGFRNFHLTTDRDPQYSTITFLLNKNPILLTALLKKMMLGKLRISDGNLKVAESIIECIKDDEVSSFFSRLIETYKEEKKNQIERQIETSRKQTLRLRKVGEVEKKSKELLKIIKG